MGALFSALQNRGYRVVGPTVAQEAIIYAELSSADDLPEGWTDEQDGGKYQLKKRSDRALFGYAVVPHSWKKFLDPPETRMWRATRNGGEIKIIPQEREIPLYAFLGVRSCDLHAMAAQDRVFIESPHTNPYYKAVRDKALIIAVQCGQAGGTCFCVSMKTGPRATFGFDLALTEIIEPGRHAFLIETGSERGEEILRELPTEEATARDREQANQILAATASHMGRTLDTREIKELFYRNYDHPRWDDVAKRCLSCANCTMACPTCFCSTIEDVTDLTGDHAERWKKQDSCFTMDFSYIHGGSVRSSTRARYRQWMTHKLATWWDQFGTSGCVGCGRCITWCPVAIDITEEARAIRESTEETHAG